MKKLTQYNGYKIFFYGLLIAYIPFALMFSDNISEMVIRAADDSNYYRFVWKIHSLLQGSNFSYALSNTSWSYGALYFLFLGIITFPVKILNGSDIWVIFFIRYANVLLLIFLFKAILSIIENYRKENYSVSNLSYKILIFVVIFTLLMPGLHMILIYLHPEILQSLLLTLHILFLYKFHKKQQNKYLVISAIFLWLSITTKLSSILYIIIPVSYFLIYHFRNHSFSKSIFFKDLFKYTVIFGCTAITLYLFNPLLIIDFSSGFDNIINEYNFFKGAAQNNAISDVEVYRKLNNTREILFAWLTHPLNHSYLHSFLFYPSLIIAITTCLKQEINKKNKGFPLLSILTISYLVNIVFYASSVTTVTSYYMLPLFIIYIPVLLINNYSILINGDKSKFKKILLYVYSFLLCINIASHLYLIYKKITYHSTIYQSRISNQHYYIESREFILSNIDKLSYNHNHLLISHYILLNLDSHQLKYCPEPHFNWTSNFCSNKPLDVHMFRSFESSYPNSVIIISKINQSHLIDIANKLQKENKLSILYEDNYSVIYSNNAS